MASSTSDPYPWKEPAQKPIRGAFIVIEGLDRAGKTTQVKKLCDRLYSEGHNVKTLRFPDRTTPMGKMIDSYLQSKTEMDDHAIHLLFSANRWEKAKWIEETLRSGYTIVCDRYYYSGMVYSAAKRNLSLDLQWAKSPDVGLPKPDLVVFLDLEPEEAEKRGGYGEEKYEKREMQKMVRELFFDLQYCQDDEEKDMKVVNAGSSIEEVGGKIWGQVAGIFVQVEKGDGKLKRVEAWHFATELLKEYGSFRDAGEFKGFRDAWHGQYNKKPSSEE